MTAPSGHVLRLPLQRLESGRSYGLLDRPVQARRRYHVRQLQGKVMHVGLSNHAAWQMATGVSVLLKTAGATEGLELGLGGTHPVGHAHRAEQRQPGLKL